MVEPGRDLVRHHRTLTHPPRHPSVHDLTGKIRDFINGWNNRRHPFIWTKTPDQILTKIERKKTSLTRHRVTTLLPTPAYPDRITRDRECLHM